MVAMTECTTSKPSTKLPQKKIHKMNKVEPSKGDLVYVPSSATLYYKDDQGSVKDYIKLNKPANLLITSVKEQTYEVFYEGQKWLVNKDKTYEVL